MTGVEIEFKFRVADQAALDAFARTLGLSPGGLVARRQQNTFFDSADGRLRQHGLSLRLRIEAGSGLLTIRGKGVPRSADGALLERFEAESSVALEDARAIMTGSLSPLACLQRSADPVVGDGQARVRAALGGEGLTCLGSFDNDRTTLPAVDFSVAGRVERVAFELDRTSFPHGRVDFEIEAEIAPETDARLMNEQVESLLSRAGIEWSTAPSKFARFLEILEQER